VRSATLVFFIVASAALCCRIARAETLQAPVGGRPISLGDGRIACAPVKGGWSVESGGHAVRPPTLDSAIGSSFDLRVAPSPGSCTQAGAVLTLVATGAWPALDAGSFKLALDEGRLEGRGRGLRGVLVSWPTEGGGRAADRCEDPKTDAGKETCAWGVPKTLSADPSTSSLQWMPSGARATADAVFFDSDGRKAPPETFAIVPSRVEIMDILPSDASIDVSSGVGRVPLSHAEAVAGVECGGVRCSLESGTLVVQAPPASATSIDVKVRLVPHVVYTRKNPPDAQPLLRVSIVRCPMTVVSGPALRGSESARVVVRLEGACMNDVASLRFLVGARHADVVQIERATNASYAVLSIGNVDTPGLSITAVRGEGEGAAVAVARTETRPLPVVRTVLEIPGFPPVDFIPNNRRAIVHHPRVAGAELVLLPVEDVYEARNEGGVSTVQGDVNAAGAVTLEFGYRVPGLPAPLDKVDLAILPDALHRDVKEANIPAPFGESAFSLQPLVEVICTDSEGRAVRAVPGAVLHLPFSSRDGCRVLLHRERLSAEYGTQKLSLQVDVNKLDGTARGEAHLSQTIVLRAGTESRVAWIKGVVAPYDRVVIRLSHLAHEAHYLGALEIATGAPAVQWSILFGTGHVRIYATTAIPTGLYRFGTTQTSGVLALSLMVISRLTWLDTEGHEGLLGLEAGVMAFGLTGPSNQAMTQIGAVFGVGLSIPIAGAGSPTQASINLHCWAEERITGSGPDEASSKRAIVFGPSISVGNVGTTF